MNSGHRHSPLLVTPLQPRTDDRRLKRPRKFLFNLATAPLRRLPDFLVIGEMKCATSSFFNALCDHPKILRPFRKETHYFLEGQRRGEMWYRAHFPFVGPGDAITGEATPGYLFDKTAPLRIAARLPHAKFIVLLRDPVERALSHYHHEVRMGRETLPLPQAIEAEGARLAQARGTAQETETRLHGSYVGRGNYAASLRRWFDAFEASRFLILETADFARYPVRELQRSTEFLGIGPYSEAVPEEKKNTGNYPSPDDGIRELLRANFADVDKELARMLGRRMSWMDR